MLLLLLAAPSTASSGLPPCSSHKSLLVEHQNQGVPLPALDRKHAVHPLALQTHVNPTSARPAHQGPRGPHPHNTPPHVHHAERQGATTRIETDTHQVHHRLALRVRHRMPLPQLVIRQPLLMAATVVRVGVGPVCVCVWVDVEREGAGAGGGGGGWMGLVTSSGGREGAKEHRKQVAGAGGG